jgi:transcriptional regulator with XRE-family HTH domain
MLKIGAPQLSTILTIGGKSVFDLENETKEFHDSEYREDYADEFLNTFVATQIHVIREQRGMTQEEFAIAIGTKQAGVSRIENVNYSSWNVKTLKKVARALGCRLHISFETYGSLLEEGAAFTPKALQRPSFEDDPAFKTAGRPIQGIQKSGKILQFRQPENRTSISRRKDTEPSLLQRAAAQAQ